MSVAGTSNFSSGRSSNTEDFWNQKKQTLQSLKQNIRNGKRNLLVRRGAPSANRSWRRPTQQQPAAAAGRSRSLAAISQQPAASNRESTNYRNYLRTRFPHVAAAAAAAAGGETGDDNYDVAPALTRQQQQPQQQQQQRQKPQSNKDPNENDEDLLEAYIYFCENRRFAHDFVAAFIEQHLDEDEIPDILMDSVTEAATGRQPKQQQQQQKPARNVTWQSRSSSSSAALGLQQQRQHQQLQQQQQRANSSSSQMTNANPLAPQPDDSEAVADILRRINRRPAQSRFGNGRHSRLAPLTPTTDSSSGSPTVRTPANSTSREAASVDAMQTLLRDFLPQLLREIAVDAVAEEAGGVVSKISLADIVAPHLLNEVIDELLHELCSDAVKELALQQVTMGFHYDIFVEMVDELVQEYGPAIASRTDDEDFLENLLDKIVDPVVDQMLIGVAADVLTEYDDKLRIRDLKELKRTAKQKPLDSLVMQLLVEKAAAGDSVLITSGTLHKFIDATELDILLKQRQLEQEARQFTIDCTPLRLIQQRMFADAAAAVVTDELLQHIDADLADLDFDEVIADQQQRYITNIADIYNTSGGGQE